MALRHRELVAVLHGVYIAPADSENHELLLRAVAAWDPDAVVTGPAAAAVTFWPRLPVSAIDVVTARTSAKPGFSLHRWRLPAEHVIERDGVKLTSAPLTALMLSHDYGGSAVDEVLRARMAGLEDLHAALAAMPGRIGNPARALLLADSRDEPWSAAERLAHRQLRSAGIDGWHANFPLTVDGSRYYLDIAFPRERLVLEIDGFAHHSSREAFERDRTRQNQLMLAGWTVLRYTWSTLTDHPEVFVREVNEWLGR